MNIQIRQEDNIVILDLEGNIDINASDFIETVGWAIINKSKNILCNFEGVNMVDYVGVSVIAIAYKNVLNNSGVIKIYNVPPQVQKLFAVVGLDKVFDSYDSEEDALRSFHEERNMDIVEKRMRRRFKRIPYRGIIEYRQKFSTDEVFYKGKILNMSAIGVLLIAPKIFSVGDILCIRMSFTSKTDILETDARVIWLTDRDIQPFESQAMGLEFYKISEEKQKIIVEFVEKHFASDNF